MHPLLTRDSTRISHAPSYLADCHSLQTSTLLPYFSSPAIPYNIPYVLSYNKYSPFTQANKLNCWKHATSDELQALVNNHTWSIVDLLPGKVHIGFKWVY